MSYTSVKNSMGSMLGTPQLWWGDRESLLASWILETRSER